MVQRRSKKNYNPAAARMKITSQKLIKMKMHRIMSQMKEKDKSPEKQLNEVEIGNLSEKESRTIKVKMIQDPRKRMEKMQEMFTKDLEEQKNKQPEMNNTLEGNNSR